MGSAVEECEGLQKKVQILLSEVEKLQTELSTHTGINSASSPDSITSQEVNQSLSSPPWSCGKNNVRPMTNKNKIMSDNVTTTTTTTEKVTA